MISRDTGCRPHEILNIKIKDVVFKTAGNHQYAEVLVNGKTGIRHIHYSCHSSNNGCSR
jgi:integrase